MHLYTFLTDAISDNFDPAIIGFMYHYREELDICNIDFWKEVNKVYKKNFSEGFGSQLIQFIASRYRINTDIASKLLGYTRHEDIINNLPNVEKLLMGSDYTLYSKSMSVSQYIFSFQYIFNTMMCYQLVKYHNNVSDPEYLNKWNKAAGNYIKYIIKRFGADIAVACFKHAIQLYNLPLTNHELWTDVIDNYGVIINEPRTRR